MDRLTEIEQALEAVFLGIREDTPTEYGHVYENTVTVVNIDDEAILDSVSDFPSVCVYLDGDEVILDGQANAYECELPFKFVCSVVNDSVEGLPLFDINRKMNSVLSDVKALISLDNTIGGVCDMVTLTSSKRVYSEDGHAIRAGDIEIYANVRYSQSRSRPKMNIC